MLSKKWTGQTAGDWEGAWTVIYPGNTLVRPGVPVGQVLRCSGTANYHLYKTLPGGAQEQADLLSALVGGGFTVISFSEKGTDLEDLYLQLMRGAEA